MGLIRAEAAEEGKGGMPKSASAPYCDLASAVHNKAVRLKRRSWAAVTESSGAQGVCGGVEEGAFECFDDGPKQFADGFLDVAPLARGNGCALVGLAPALAVAVAVGVFCDGGAASGTAGAGGGGGGGAAVLPTAEVFAAGRISAAFVSAVCWCVHGAATTAESTPLHCASIGCKAPTP